MRLLSDHELASLSPSETATFPGPIPTQSVSSDEFMPAPQTANQRRVVSPLAILMLHESARVGTASRTAVCRVVS